LIRDVDPAVIRTLKFKAEINGTSLQAEARLALTQGSPLTAAEKDAVFAELDRRWGDRPCTVDGATIMRELREEEV
jgi:plasmid stability protein